MRRSASPSKTNRSAPPARAAPSDTSILKTPFKPLSGLPSRPPSLRQPTPAGPSTAVLPRDVRTRSIDELQQDVAEMQLVLDERLNTHNAARKKAGLREQTPQQVVDEYIALLTQYNRVKDAAQVVFDKIADIEQLPAKDIHSRYGVGEGGEAA
ncbi:DNA repair protein, Swi5 [Kalmanozyma brasiliensis GHG001]|uniref:Swi5-domain-containing protein n=1 Tax=Kalmanozyma brasiliensis (strain GHG001) TaxID=1365824 RepID=V5ENM5_KALBG|nr:DNA repair protein, Swi5 [Kalmanozyma brasiliensis GHG001]EST06685.1 DNA repair protein, Swi5 [Kalmanozyma brasiliensis GHG001]